MSKPKKPKRKGSAERFRLVHVRGCVEPCLWGEEVEGWDAFERILIKFLATDDYDQDEDGVFFIELSAQGRLKDICAFSGGYMDEMRERAEKLRQKEEVEKDPPK